jgi:signal transduction histidine kinase
VRILDSGPGLDRAMAERLFEPFATGKPEGIGLGLAVARKIAEAHGGSIRYIEQRPTCFEVTLPAGPIGEEQAADVAKPQDEIQSALSRS